MTNSPGRTTSGSAAVRLPRPVQILGVVVTVASLVSELVATPADSAWGRVAMGLLHLALLATLVHPALGGAAVLGTAVLAWAVGSSTSGAAFLILAMGLVAWATAPLFKVLFAIAAAIVLGLEFWPGGQWLTLGFSTIALLVMFAAGSYLHAGSLARVAVQEWRERSQAEVDAALAVERQAIARELHDIVAHELTIISMHTHVAVHPRTDDAGQRAALEQIREASRRALVDLRLMLSVLRQDSRPESAAAPRLLSDEIESISNKLTNSGYEVSTDIEPIKIHKVVESCLVRVIQESATNILKHAGTGSRVHILLRPLGRGTLILEITNGLSRSGDHSPPYRGGQLGLVGMRERINLLGGSFEAGETPDGWRVAVTLPLEIEAGSRSRDIDSEGEPPAQQAGADVPQE